MAASTGPFAVFQEGAGGEAPKIRGQDPYDLVAMAWTQGIECGVVVACLAMVFKLAEAAARKWRRLMGAGLVRDVFNGVQFKDGIRAEDAA